MRIACIGGGPAGLFLALLLQREGHHHVEVFERNDPDATFGFGVVFSRLSLARLRTVAPDVVTDLLACGAQWEDLEVRSAGASVRSSGHGFAAVERRQLLEVLQRHAYQAGATLKYGCEASVDSLADDFDLIVAADGANSRSRTGEHHDLGVRSTGGATRYAWFAADRVFENMTFLFGTSKFGPVAAHAYPYAEDRSTFLVELDADTWRRAGFTDGHQHPGDWTDPQALDFARDVFADDLRGARLYGNGSRWLRFPQITAERWSSGKVVGIGDAVHTAHFSVGSGTTMALEDARGLSAQLTPGRHADLPTALAAFERSCRPMVDAIQEAAWASRRVWECPAVEDGAASLLVRLLSRTGQLSLRKAFRLDRGLSAELDLPASGLPDRQPPTAASWDGRSPLPPADHLILSPQVWAQEPPKLAGASHGSARAALLMAPDLADQRARRQYEHRVWELSSVLPDIRLGLLLSGAAAGEGAVAEQAADAVALMSTAGVDLVAIGPAATGTAAGNRIAQMVLADAVRAAAGDSTTVVYLCGEDELEYGWTHVTAGRADEVWTLLPPPATR